MISFNLDVMLEFGILVIGQSESVTRFAQTLALTEFVNH